MARVNHKRVKQLLNEKRSKITDRQFFCSRILAGHYEDMAAAQTKRYHYNRRVRVNLFWRPKNPSVAETDNSVIRINTGSHMVTKVRGRENRYEIVTGLFSHELGHVLFTDFPASQTYSNTLACYRWFPAAPALKSSADFRNENEFWDYLKADLKNLQMVQMVAHYISNVLEDGYIENRMLNSFPGTLGYCLDKVRQSQYEDIPSVTQLIEGEEDGHHHIFESILQLMLSYAKFGVIRYGDEPLSDERVQVVFGLINDIDAALMTHSAKERLQVVSLILIRCWPYIRDFIELCKERQEEAMNAGSAKSVAETLSELLQAISGSTEIGEGSTTPVPDAGEGVEVLINAAQRAKTNEDAQETSEGSSPDPGESEEQSQSEEAEAAENQSEEESQSDKEESSPAGDDSESDSSPASAEKVSGTGDGKQEVSETETGRINLEQTEQCSAPVGGTTLRDDDYERIASERAASDIERILDKMAEEAACEELESERLQELNDTAKSISYGNIHAGVNIKVNRIAHVDIDLIEQYEQISAPLLDISRQLQKSLVRQLKEERRGGKQTGLLIGRRLDSHALHRTDGKLFYKNSLPNDIPELAVGLLLDESGSMCSRDRCTYARAAAIILYDFCQSLNIPIMVYGHSTGYDARGSTVELYSYAEFDSIDRDDKYRLMDIGARDSNRDGAALRFVSEQLSKRPETVKILILVSDGQPADTGYYGTAAEEDLRGIKQEYQRRKILFVAAAIGDDKPSIERIYGDSFLDITDLTQLPVKLTNVVKRHIRV